MSIPKRVFIVPYRDREVHKVKFLEHMNSYLSDSNDWEIFFAHQCDNRPFNRGAMKNIGFLAIKRKYPQNYKDITFIFHDVDSYPRFKGMIPYNTHHGVVAHYYGYEFALGGMFAIKGNDFEKTGGFPNLWAWGLEDNIMRDRCSRAKLVIDRSCFFHISDQRICRLFDGFKRIYSQREISIYKYEKPDTIRDIRDINYEIKDNFINIKQFNVREKWQDLDYKTKDIRSGRKIKIQKGYSRKIWSMSNMFLK